MTAQALSGGRRSAAAAAAAAAVAMDGSTAAPRPSGRPWRAQERVPDIRRMLGYNAFCTTMPRMSAGIARSGRPWASAPEAAPGASLAALSKRK